MDNNDALKQANEQIEKAINNMSSTSYDEEQSERLMEDFGGIPTGAGNHIDSNDKRLQEVDQQVQEVFETNDIDLSELNMENFGGIPTGVEKTNTIRK